MAAGSLSPVIHLHLHRLLFLWQGKSIFGFDVDLAADSARLCRSLLWRLFLGGDHGLGAPWQQDDGVGILQYLCAGRHSSQPYGFFAGHWQRDAGWQLGERVVSSFQTLFLVYAVLLSFCLLLLVLIPSVVPKHEDYYEP